MQRTLILCSLVLLVGCSGWGNVEPTPQWPVSEATEADMDAVGGCWNCAVWFCDNNGLTTTDTCGSNLQEAAWFTEEITTKDVPDKKVGGTFSMTAGGITDTTWEEQTCPGYELFADLTDCGGFTGGHYDSQFTVYPDDFEGFDQWTDGVVDGCRLAHGYLANSSRPVVGNFCGNNDTIYLFDSQGDTPHSIFFYDLPADIEYGKGTMGGDAYDGTMECTRGACPAGYPTNSHGSFLSSCVWSDSHGYDTIY